MFYIYHKMEIYLAKFVSDQLIDAMRRLIPQLDESVPIPDIHALSRIVNSKTSNLFVVEIEGQIVASATLIIFEVGTGKKAWLEDLVVETKFRRKGIGQSLVNAILDYASSQGLMRVDLTSNLKRFAAHELYKKAGFEQRESNIFRKELI